VLLPQSSAEYGDVHLDLLEERGVLLGEPCIRQLSGKLRELRFYCGGERIRISHWIASGRRIIALTVFAKTKLDETAGIARGAAAIASRRTTPPRRRDDNTMSQDTPRRTRLAEARQARTNRPEVAAAHEQTRLRYELGEAVRLRREELGWSQRQLAERAGMSQPGVARFEAGGTNPTLPLLERLAKALGLTRGAPSATTAHSPR
jgi:HTH-type transcriptional regulator / antitoxin HipB